MTKLVTLAHLTFCIFVILLSPTIHAEITLPNLFSDHMVLQRDTNLVISGTAKANEAITLSIAQQKLTTHVNENGNWKITLPPQNAGGPFQLYVETPTEEKIINDVYFGDVWLASGQSNMEWKLKWQVDNWQAEVAESDYPLIRYFDIPNEHKPTEQTTLAGGEWKVASPAVSEEFSAVAWFFAKRLHLEKNIPVAIIDSTWGGTPAEAWTPLNELIHLSGYQQSAQDLINNPIIWDGIFEQTKKEEGKKYQLVNNTAWGEKHGIILSTYDDSEWQSVELPLPTPTTDILWARKSVTLTQAQLAQASKNAHISFGWVANFTTLYVNGHVISERTDHKNDAAFIVPTSILKTGENLLVIRTLNDWDNNVNLGQNNRMFFTLVGNSKEEKISLQGTWKINNTLEGPLPMPEKYWQKTGVLYNAMIHPIIHFPLKGVIWYQGESNIDRANEYRELFTTMITSWRKLWQQPDLPFIFAQLSSLHAIQPHPMESDWALLREAQTQSLALKNTGMSVLIDAGDPFDIHPRNKQIVGKRLFAEANKIAYKENIVASGPMATEFIIENNTLSISYQDIGTGLALNLGPNGQKNEKVIGFEIAGSDGIYVNADAIIKENKVIISAENIKQPKSVRYGWADNSPANLYNKEGFPAVPFRMGE